MVYDKPRGSITQELGGTLLTAYALCKALDLDPEIVFVTELRRVLAKAPKYFEQRNETKISLGLA
jgi:hypothetical protein